LLFRAIATYAMNTAKGKKTRAVFVDDKV